MHRRDVPRAIERIAHAGCLLTARGERVWQICAEHTHGPSCGGGPSAKGDISDPTANAALGPAVDDRLGDLRQALRVVWTTAAWIRPATMPAVEAPNLPLWARQLNACANLSRRRDAAGELVAAQISDIGHAADACDRLTAIIEQIPAVDMRWCWWCWDVARTKQPAARGRYIKGRPCCVWHYRFRARHQRMPTAAEVDRQRAQRVVAF